MIRYIDDRLWRWADYMREAGDFGLGYPRRNTIHKAMREGPGAGHRRTSSDPIPGDIEQTDAAVASLPVQLRRVVWSKYMRRRTDKHSARYLKVSDGTLRLRIDQAHYWIAGRVSDVA